MTINKWAAVAAAFAGIVGAVPAMAKVDVIQSSSPVLAQGATFAWAQMRAIGLGMSDPAIANEITANRLRVATEAALAAKGYRRIDDPSGADLIVAYTLVMQRETDGKLTSSNVGCGFPFCAVPNNYNLDTAHHTHGTLVLDLIERETGQLVWRATSKKRVTGKDATEKKLTGLLREMTKALPTHKHIVGEERVGTRSSINTGATY